MLYPAGCPAASTVGFLKFRIAEIPKNSIRSGLVSTAPVADIAVQDGTDKPLRLAAKEQDGRHLSPLGHRPSRNMGKHV